MTKLFGHVALGFTFSSLGLWRLFNNIKLHSLHPNSFTSPPWFPSKIIRHIELFSLMAVSSIFIASELYWGFRIPLHNSDLIIPLNRFRHFEHATISLNFFTHAAFAIILDKIGSKAHYALTLFLEPIAFGQDFLLAMELASGAVLPMTMKSATELGLLEIMAKVSPTQLSSSEIASQLPTNNKKTPIILDRMLRLLASYSFLTCNLVSNKDGSVQRLYGLTPVSKYFVPNKDGVSLAPTLLIIQDKISMDSWSCAKDALLEGSVPFMKAHNGMDGFAAAAKDERINNLFNQSMHNHTTIVMKEILEIYKGFEGLNQLVDVAGGLGANLKSVVSKYPQLRGINFDLPHVLKHAPSCPGVEHVGGDMFVEVPKGQAIFMKWILHDWSDEDCSKILKNCYEAIPESGKVILVESIVPEFPETDIVSKNIASLDVHLSNLFPGAKERTLAEFKALATGVGFADMKVICRVYFYWVIEFYKTI